MPAADPAAPTRFVIVAGPRTGSSLLVSLLSSHPDILCRGEVFNPNEPALTGLDPATAPDRAAAFRRDEPVAFADWLFGQSDGRRYVDFKIFADHNPAVLQHLLADRGVAKVVLRRDNFLAVYSSAMIARARRTHSYRVGDEPPETRITFEPKKFEKLRARYAAHYAAVDAAVADQPAFRLEYHEVADPAAQARLLAFLGAAPATLASDHLKANPADLIARFDNPGKVRRYLAEHGLEHWAGVEAPSAAGALMTPG